MTEELAQKLISLGISNPRLYTIMKQIYEQSTAEEIAETIAYIRAEITLGVFVARTPLVPDPTPKRTTKTTKITQDQA